MKPYIYLLAGVMSLASCKNTKNTDNQVAEEVQDIVSSSINQDTHLIDSLENKFKNSHDALERINLQKQIVDLKLKNTSEEEKGRIFDQFTLLVYKELDNINLSESDYLRNYYEHRLDDEGNRISPPDFIKQKEKPFLDAGLKFDELGEGIVEIVFDDNFFNQYINKLPESYQEYWRLVADTKHIIHDAYLVISWRELGDLIAQYEDYVKKYPDNLGYFSVLSEGYKRFQWAYVVGIDNSPITDEDGNLSKEVKEEWQRFSKAYPNSPTTQLIKIMLAEKNFKNTSQIYQKMEKEQAKLDYPLIKI